MSFIMRDSQHYMIRSEKLPTYGQKDVGHKDSEILLNAYAWKPGLYALIKFAKSAKTQAKNVQELNAKISRAMNTYKNAQADDNTHAKAIFELRKALRNSGTPQAKSLIINRFPTDPLF